MKKEEVIFDLCCLCMETGKHFDSLFAHDCFCGMAPDHGAPFQFDPRILKYIRQAVYEKIAREEEREKYTKEWRRTEQA